MDISHNDIDKIMETMGIFILSFENYYIIRSKIIKKAVLELFYANSSEIQKLHVKLSNFLELSPNSARKHEEICYHLFYSSSLFKLKETISSIVPFLFLFNMLSKYDLFFYWNKLSKKSFDPSIEYNNALEAYCLKFILGFEDMFKICLQISRFLKEFGEFENNLTPDFRHPFIRKCPELSEIYFNDEGMRLELINDNFADRKTTILNKYETLNVDVPVNREVLRDHYLEIVKSEIQRNNIHKQDNNIVNPQQTLRKNTTSGSNSVSVEDLSTQNLK